MAESAVFSRRYQRRLVSPNQAAKTRATLLEIYLFPHNFSPILTVYNAHKYLVYNCHNVYNAHMSLMKREVWHCDQCGWEWIPRGGKEVPECCPNRKCRSRKWNMGGSEVRPKQEAVQDGAKRAWTCAGCGWEMPGGGYCPNCGRFNGEEKSKGRKMTAKEFMELSPSEQMRAKREGKF